MDLAAPYVDGGGNFSATLEPYLACRDLKPKHLVCLGGFKNMRQDYNYEGLKMELDETSYEWGLAMRSKLKRYVLSCGYSCACDTGSAHQR